MQHLSHVHRNFVLALMLTLAASAALAQGPSSTSVGASASLTIPLEIYDTGLLNFGELVKTAAHDTGEVIVSYVPYGNSHGALVSADPTKVVTNQVVDETHTAIVHFTGDPLRQVIGTFPSSIELEKVPGTSSPQQLMTLELTGGAWAFPEQTQLPWESGAFQMPPGGKAYFDIGGHLHVKSDNESGVYSGMFPVTLSYL